jgi:hypothetical protein
VKSALELAGILAAVFGVLLLPVAAGAALEWWRRRRR